MIELLIYLIKTVIVLTLGVIPGWLLLKWLTKQEGWELLLNSVAFSIVFAAASEFAAYLLNIDATLFNFVATMLFCAVCFIGICSKRPHRVVIPRLFWIFALAFIAVVFVQALIPFYSGAYWYGDWWLHYDIANFYLDHGSLTKTWFPQQYTVTSRTPIFNLAGAYAMSLLGREFWSFQIIATFMNTAFLIPLALLAKRFGFDKKSAAALAVAIAVLNASLLTNEYYTWSKLIISLFLLGAIWYYLELRKQLFAGKMNVMTAAFFGFYAAASYMCHQTALFFLIPIALDFMLASLLVLRESRRKFMKASWRSLAVLLLAAFVVLAPWHAWAFNNYGVKETLSSSPATKDLGFPKGFLDDRIQNGVATLLPVFQNEWYGKWFANSSPLELLKCKTFACFGAFYSVTLRFWLDVLPGTLTITGTIALLAILAGAILSGSIKKMFNPREPEFLFLLMLPISFFLGTFSTTMYVDNKGWMPLFLPILLILQCVLARSIANWRPILRIITIGGIILEFALIKGSHVFFLFTEQITKFETYNLPLKTDNNLIFAFDYLGGERIFLAVAALAIFSAFAAAALWLAVAHKIEKRAETLI